MNSWTTIVSILLVLCASNVSLGQRTDFGQVFQETVYSTTEQPYDELVAIATDPRQSTLDRVIALEGIGNQHLLRLIDEHMDEFTIEWPVSVPLDSAMLILEQQIDLIESSNASNLSDLTDSILIQVLSEAKRLKFTSLFLDGRYEEALDEFVSSAQLDMRELWMLADYKLAMSTLVDDEERARLLHVSSVYALQLYGNGRRDDAEALRSFNRMYILDVINTNPQVFIEALSDFLEQCTFEGRDVLSPFYRDVIRAQSLLIEGDNDTYHLRMDEIVHKYSGLEHPNLDPTIAWEVVLRLDEDKSFRHGLRLEPLLLSMHEFFYVANLYQRIGSSLRNNEQYEQAIEHLKKAIEYLDKSPEHSSYWDAKGVMAHYIASSYRRLANIDSTERWCALSTEINSHHNRKHWHVAGDQELGFLYMEDGQFERSLPYSHHAWRVKKTLSVGPEQKVWPLVCLGEAHLGLGNLDSAKYYSDTALAMAEGDASPTMYMVYELAHKLYSQIGQHELAYEYSLLANQFRDLWGNKQSSANVVSSILAEESLRKEKASEVEQAKKEAAAQQKLDNEEERQMLILGAGLVVALLLGVIVFIIRSRLKNSQHQRLIIEEKNQEIIDSLSYAKRIQSAILPPDNLVQNHLANSFVLYEPKDIVAGDFYWMEPLSNGVLFAAADCTGHGVPGAMVSVVCNNAMNRAVREFELCDPARILDKTRDIVTKEFEKSEEEVKDGMDIALCKLEGTTLTYAGAHNPLWIIRNGSTEVESIRADKQPIGRYLKDDPFTSHSTQLNSGDTMYIFSDGFVDQFGGERGKKYKPGQFKRFLLSIQDEELSVQKELLLKEFETWRGEIEQVDDVCVIGVRV